MACSKALESSVSQVKEGNTLDSSTTTRSRVKDSFSIQTALFSKATSFKEFCRVKGQRSSRTVTDTMETS